MSVSPPAQREFARNVVARLRDAGYTALWAGGCVRDHLLGLVPKDYDVATSARPEEIRELFGRRRTLAIGAAFGVVSVRGDRRSGAVEVATFRIDGEYRDGRRPASVEFTDAEHDARRRDFTINGLFYDPLEERVVDYVGGVADIEARLLRAIGDPRARFAEDRLRMLRAVRFAAAYRLTMDGATLAAIREMAGGVVSVSGERIGAELRRVLVDSQRRRGVELLAESRLLAELCPEVASVDPATDARWDDALTRLERLVEPTLPTALAAMLAGLVDGAAVKVIGRRWRLPNREADRAAWLVVHLPTLLNAAWEPWPRLQRLLAHDGGPELLALARAAASADDAGLARCTGALERGVAAWNPPPLVTGDDLLAAGVPAGRHFAALLDYLRDEQLEGRLASAGDALAAARRWADQHAAG